MKLLSVFILGLHHNGYTVLETTASPGIPITNQDNPRDQLIFLEDATHWSSAGTSHCLQFVYITKTKKCANEYEVRKASNRNGYLTGGWTKRYNKWRMTAPAMEHFFKMDALRNLNGLSAAILALLLSERAGHLGRRKKRARRAKYGKMRPSRRRRGNMEIIA